MGPTAPDYQLDHLGIAVSDVREAAADLEARLGAGPGRPEQIEPDGIWALFLDLGGQAVELLSPVRPDSSISRFLERRGEGLHHVAYRVTDIERELRRWERLGAQLIDSEPRPGSRGRLVAFVHPRTEHGVLTELVQAAVVTPPAPAPGAARVVFLCGSRRFADAYSKADREETAAGRIAVACYAGPAGADQPEAPGTSPGAQGFSSRSKIDLADEVLVLNVGGYVGEATAREVAYASAQGKPLRWLEPPGSSR